MGYTRLPDLYDFFENFQMSVLSECLQYVAGEGSEYIREPVRLAKFIQKVLTKIAIQWWKNKKQSQED